MTATRDTVSSAAYCGIRNVSLVGGYERRIPDCYFHDSFLQLIWTLEMSARGMTADFAWEKRVTR
jgi:hypothetical protein